MARKARTHAQVVAARGAQAIAQGKTYFVEVPPGPSYHSYTPDPVPMRVQGSGSRLKPRNAVVPREQWAAYNPPVSPPKAGRRKVYPRSGAAYKLSGVHTRTIPKKVYPRSGAAYKLSRGHTRPIHVYPLGEAIAESHAISGLVALRQPRHNAQKRTAAEALLDILNSKVHPAPARRMTATMTAARRMTTRSMTAAARR